MIHFKLDTDHQPFSPAFKERKFTSEKLLMFLSIYKEITECYIKDSKANNIKCKKLMSVLIYQKGADDKEIAFKVFRNVVFPEYLIITRTVFSNWEVIPGLTKDSQYLLTKTDTYNYIMTCLLERELVEIANKLPELFK